MSERIKDERERIMERVARMLRLANDKSTTEEERDNAMRMAHTYLAKYNLDLSEVESRDKKPVAGETRGEKPAKFYGRPWARVACQGIAELFFCSYLYVSAKKATDVRHYFIGRESNAITASLIAEFVVNSIMKEAKREARQAGKGNAAVRAFGWGAAHRVHGRCLKIRADAEMAKPETDGNPGTALVLASVYDHEKVENALYIARRWGDLRPGRSGKGIADHEAYQSGDCYGQSVPLNRQVS